MCMGNTPKAPPPPAPPVPPPEPPKMVDSDVQRSREEEKLQARRAAGRSGSIKTGTDLESSDPNTAKRTLA